MRVTLTGADGLLGSNLVRRLLAHGHSVTALIERGRTPITLEGLPIERIEGDLLERESLRALCRGAEAVIHAGAAVSVWPSRSLRVCRVNIEGTENLIRAAAAEQIDRFIYIGTASSFTPGSRENPGNEQTPFGCWKYGLDYIDSKYEGQRMVLAAYHTDGFPALTVNPTFMLGPFDAGPSSGQLLIGLYQKRLPGCPPGGKCWTHVGDVAEAVTAALSEGRPGESYIAGNFNLSYREFLTMAAEVLGLRPPAVQLPRAAVTAGAAMSSALASVTGRPPLLSLPMAKISCDGHYYDPSKAKRELHMPSTPLESAVKESFSWMREHGVIR